MNDGKVFWRYWTRFLAGVSKLANCPRCGAPLTQAGNCSQLCGGA